MRPLLIALTLLAATIAAAQHVPGFPPDSPAETPSGCPVMMYAHQQGDPVAMWTASLEDANKFPYKSDGRSLLPHSGVHVNLNAQRRAIKQVELVVSFMPPGTRVMPVTGGQFQAEQKVPASEGRKNFQLFAEDGSSLKLSGNLLLGPVAGITRITLVRIDYADGGSWTSPTRNSCSIKPSLYMPVNAK